MRKPVLIFLIVLAVLIGLAVMAYAASALADSRKQDDSWKADFGSMSIEDQEIYLIGYIRGRANAHLALWASGIKTRTPYCGDRSLYQTAQFMRVIISRSGDDVGLATMNAYAQVCLPDAD